MHTISHVTVKRWKPRVGNPFKFHDGRTDNLLLLRSASECSLSMHLHAYLRPNCFSTHLVRRASIRWTGTASPPRRRRDRTHTGRDCIPQIYPWDRWLEDKGHWHMTSETEHDTRNQYWAIQERRPIHRTLVEWCRWEKDCVDRGKCHHCGAFARPLSRVGTAFWVDTWWQDLQSWLRQLVPPQPLEQPIATASSVGSAPLPLVG
jgi:hypothetical protein